MSTEINQYEGELGLFDETYELAMETDIRGLKDAISDVSKSSIIGVGSGGSYTVASLLCVLHESYTSRVSRPSTPLEIICNPTLSVTSPVFLISAEGKNPDITEALKRARNNSARNIHVLTNRKNSPLTRNIEQLTDVAIHIFELDKKDGYLATNSLLMDSILVARTYNELDPDKDSLLPSTLNCLELNKGNIDEWINNNQSIVEQIKQRRSIIIVYSPLLQPIATDLESKLSESALLFSQVIDIRSLAHGRHIWLSERAEDCSILAIVEPMLLKLWKDMASLIPKDTPILTMELAGSKPKDLIAGLVAQMKFIGSISRKMGKDPGKPDVPQFSRNLYYLDLSEHITNNQYRDGRDNDTKNLALGARWPYKLRAGLIQRAREKFCLDIEQQAFKVIVFDYDGTLCSSQRKEPPPPDSILVELIRLIENGVTIGIATGRGGSIKEHLRECLSETLWPNVILGLYNGGSIMNLEDDDPSESGTSEFLNHAMRILGELKSHGVPIEKIKPTQPYQVSVRFSKGIDTEYMWYVIADSLRQAGLDLSKLLRSKHSIDILSPNVNKSRLIAHIIQKIKVEPHQILTIGDQGAWPGNDTELLEHRFSLSVDLPSRRLDRGWNLAPAHKRNVDATLWYLSRIQFTKNGEFCLDILKATDSN